MVTTQQIGLIITSSSNFGPVNGAQLKGFMGRGDFTRLHPGQKEKREAKASLTRPY